MELWRRAIDFLRMIDGRAAEQVVPYDFGRALIHRRLNLVHDLNYLIADRVADVTVHQLMAEAERIQGEAGLRHRRINVDDQPAAERLAGGFASHGYQPERFLIMVHRRPLDPQPAGHRVEEVDWGLMRPARRLEISRQPFASIPGLVEQILAKHELTARCVETRYFAALSDGKVASSCELRCEGAIAQVETVETLEEFRGRGLSRAVVTAAIEAASVQDFIFLVTDVEDWPQHFYGRLGFDGVGIESRFLRLLDH